jgi:hypothetical protein
MLILERLARLKKISGIEQVSDSARLEGNSKPGLATHHPIVRRSNLLCDPRALASEPLD